MTYYLTSEHSPVRRPFCPPPPSSSSSTETMPLTKKEHQDEAMRLLRQSSMFHACSEETLRRVRDSIPRHMLRFPLHVLARTRIAVVQSAWRD